MAEQEVTVYKEGQKVLFIQNDETDSAASIEQIRSQVGSSGHVELASLESMLKLSPSSFDAVCFVDPIFINKVDFSGVLCMLRPNGVLNINTLASVNGSGSLDQVQSALKLNGFINVNVTNLSSADSEKQQLKHGELSDNNTLLCHVCASKPAYEVGASMPLKLASKSEAVKAWTLSSNDMLDDDFDVLDSDDVLDDIDLKKPDPSSLKADCGTGLGAKRKACKNCSCGLAEELEAENVKVDTAKAKSSCGSCYLGDAFRCASCPYSGMPAFKPGEKIALPVLSLQDDL